MTVLIVDDERAIRHLVRDNLQDRGMQVTMAATVAEATAAIATRTFLVVVLDLTLPDGSGLEVLDLLRKSGSPSHVIVLSGSTAERERVEALQRGADDFVVKPFFVRELTARVLAVRRRRDPALDTCVEVGECKIDLLSRDVARGGEVLDLTAKEFDLLAYLAARPGHVFSREQLLNAVWQSTSGWQQSATVTEHIRRLRNKIEPDPGHPTILVTVRGAGYRLDIPRDDAERASPRRPPEAGVIVEVDRRVVFADHVAAAMFDVSSGRELVGLDVLELFASSSQAAASARVASIDAGRQRRSEIMQLRRADDEPVTVRVSSTTADWHGKPARRVELTVLSDASARLRLLVTGVLADVADAVIVTDLHFHIRSWNGAAERLYGWPEDAVLGRHVLDVLQWVGDEGQLAEAWQSLEAAGRWNGTGRQVTRDGSTVDILNSTTLLRGDSGEPIAVVSVNRLVEVAGRDWMLEPDMALAARVKQGIDDDEFVVHYQPIADVVDGHLVTLEALVRWGHPARGTLAPAEFLDAAERSGHIVELGERVLEEACRQGAAWRRGGADILLSVNVSTRQLADPGMADRFIDILRASDFDPAHLWLEITETALVEQLDTAAQALRTLVELGVGVSIDDFGTGWASLTYLQTLPVHALKIDGSFVAGAVRGVSDRAIVRSILSLGAELGLFVVAEGVETDEQHELLTAMGCTLGQGYLYGRPTPAAEVPIERAHRLAPVMASGVGGDWSGLDPAGSSGGGMAPAVGLLARERATAALELSMGTRSESRGGSQKVAGLLGPSTDWIESDAVAALLRALLRVSSASGAVDLLQRTVRKLGGTVVPAGVAGADALPIDVSLGEGSPMLVEVELFTVARMQLERLLPRMVEDARQAVDLLRRTERLQDETIRDSLTGLGNRRVLDRVLPRARTGSIVLLDLDHFKQINDEHGHAAGDDVLRAFGKTLGDEVRARDTTCRIGGEEFAIVLADLDVTDAVELVERIRTAWAAESLRPVTFSAGVAAVSSEGGTAGLLAADRAMYEAKTTGRDRTVKAPVVIAAGGPA